MVRTWGGAIKVRSVASARSFDLRTPTRASGSVTRRCIEGRVRPSYHVGVHSPFRRQHLVSTEGILVHDLVHDNGCPNSDADDNAQCEWDERDPGADGTSESTPNREDHGRDETTHDETQGDYRKSPEPQRCPVGTSTRFRHGIDGTCCASIKLVGARDESGSAPRLRQDGPFAREVPPSGIDGSTQADASWVESRS